MKPWNNSASAVLAAILLSSCGTTERDWKQARDADTVSAYKNFIAKHPRGSHVDEANAAIDNLDWSIAKSANTSQAFADFLSKHPRNQHAVEAQTAAENLDWIALKASETLDSFAVFYNRYPTSTRLQKVTGDIVSNPVLPFGNGIGFAISGSVPVGAAVASIKVGGKDVGISPSAEDAGRLGLIEYRPHGKTADVAAKTLKDSTLTILRGPDGKARIVAVNAASNQTAK